MSRATLQIRDLAAYLIRHEMKNSRAAAETMPSAFRACEKLQVPLETLMGRAGVCALLTRALALARDEMPRLQAVHVRPDGSLAGWEERPAGGWQRDFLEESRVLLAHLLGLLVAFIGEKLTLQFVHEAWPNLPATPFAGGQRKPK